jgi:hypothetical protein
MIDEEVVSKLRDRYANLHPLVFSRSVERARSAGELFDILESIPDDLPIMWSDEDYRWIRTDDVTQSGKFEMSWQQER